jgi:dephospho-CoA kinase
VDEKTVVIVLTGPPGAGKTSVLERLTTELERDGVEYGALDSEQLGWGSPWLSAEIQLMQLAAVLDLQKKAGRRRFLLAATTETTDDLTALVAASDADRAVVVLLTAPPELVASRLDAREPDDWPGKQQLIEHARYLSETMPELVGIDVRISTEDRHPNDVARELRDELRALGVL